MERKYGDDFGVEIVADGVFQDEGVDIRTIVIRPSCTAMNEWIMTSALNCRETYDTSEEWEAYKKKKEKMHKEWEEKILEGFNFSKAEDNCYSISQNASEIFTVVLFIDIGS